MRNKVEIMRQKNWNYSIEIQSYDRKTWNYDTKIVMRQKSKY